jgi:DNA mismatch repair protein MutS2
MRCTDEQTIEDLEFKHIRIKLSNLCFGPSAATRMLKLTPSNNFPGLEQALSEVFELHRIRTTAETFPSLVFEELSSELNLLRIRNAILPFDGYTRIADQSKLVNALLLFFDKRELDYPMLYKVIQDAYYTDEIIEAIEKVFDRNGTVKDEASSALSDIRQSIRQVRNRINRNFEREMRKLQKEQILGDTRETYLHDRRVLTVIASHKRKVSGNILGSSKTGSLTFIEPQVNVPLNFELDGLLEDEKREIERILRNLTNELHAYLPLIKTYQQILTQFDFLQAKVRLALDWNCTLPGIVKEPEIKLIEAFHPLLRETHSLAGKKTQPQQIEMNHQSRMLVISGPNAGGKSITLKTIGLLQIMLQSGLLVPVHANSNMCFFQQILSDIGDNQSIENELSTYSYRLKRIGHFLEVANRRTLLLMDEFGSGSDPDLGGALADVFFDELYRKKCFGVFTTHYASIKLKGHSLPHAQNGCMLFNTENLEPLYRFVSGQPGSSFTFEVAKINGIPTEIIDKAKERTDQRKVRLDQLLHELQQETSYLKRLNEEHIEAQKLAETSRIRYNDLSERLHAKLQRHQLRMEEQEKIFQAGKKMMQFIEKYKTKGQKKQHNQVLLDEIHTYLAVEKSKKEGQKKVTTTRSAKPKAKNDTKKLQREEEKHHRNNIQVGSTVRLVSTHQQGIVEEINGDTLTVSFGFVRMKVGLEKLSWVR